VGRLDARTLEIRAFNVSRAGFCYAKLLSNEGFGVRVESEFFRFSKMPSVFFRDEAKVSFQNYPYYFFFLLFVFFNNLFLLFFFSHYNIIFISFTLKEFSSRR